MTHQEKLVMFMEGKQKKLKEIFPDDKKWISYFTEKDKQAILNWNDENANKIWFTIKRIIKREGNLFEITGLSEFVCPFCMYHYKMDNPNYCRDCEYGENHGDCNEPDSDYGKIQKVFTEVPINLSVYTILDDVFYKNLIKEIETREENSIT